VAKQYAAKAIEKDRDIEEKAGSILVAMSERTHRGRPLDSKRCRDRDNPAFLATLQH
jgi:hypothetical protein